MLKKTYSIKSEDKKKGKTEKNIDKKTSRKASIIFIIQTHIHTTNKKRN